MGGSDCVRLGGDAVSLLDEPPRDGRTPTSPTTPATTSPATIALTSGLLLIASQTPRRRRDPADGCGGADSSSATVAGDMVSGGNSTASRAAMSSCGASASRATRTEELISRNQSPSDDAPPDPKAHD